MSYCEYILVSGGNIKDVILFNYLNLVKETNRKYKIMAIDKGIETLYNMDIKPDYILGDFDSVDKDIYSKFVDRYKDVPISKYQSEKDYTDTELGIRIALEQKADKITIFGATGTRLDHTMSNIRTLNIALKEDVFAQIIDEHNKIYLVKDSLSLYRDKVYGKYVSIIPYNETLKKVTLKGFKYDLQNAIMLYDASMGISNEIISNEASITCDNGIFIIIESKD